MSMLALGGHQLVLGSFIRCKFALTIDIAPSLTPNLWHKLAPPIIADDVRTLRNCTGHRGTIQSVIPIQLYVHSQHPIPDCIIQLSHNRQDVLPNTVRKRGRFRLVEPDGAYSIIVLAILHQNGITDNGLTVNVRTVKVARKHVESRVRCKQSLIINNHAVRSIKVLRHHDVNGFASDDAIAEIEDAHVQRG